MQDYSQLERFGVHYCHPAPNTGFELIGRLPQISDVPVLVTTAFDKEENLLRAGAMGACGHMVKPISRREFLAQVAPVVAIL